MATASEIWRVSAVQHQAFATLGHNVIQRSFKHFPVFNTELRQTFEIRAMRLPGNLHNCLRSVGEITTGVWQLKHIIGNLPPGGVIWLRLPNGGG
ncbi:conserved hypothetical protein [Ricinus communis]|uniref:Uncharacterized protein n=1 Tax=Ricinus communis TaxID=3988 RepID=B9TKH4_RICCO|nr:conserved hypothetical protein [Ricinus communis]